MDEDKRKLFLQSIIKGTNWIDIPRKRGGLDVRQLKSVDHCVDCQDFLGTSAKGRSFVDRCEGCWDKIGIVEGPMAEYLEDEASNRSLLLARIITLENDLEGLVQSYCWILTALDESGLLQGDVRKWFKGA
jgi:hypothetical protein